MLSPLLFNCVMNRILREVTEMLGGGLNIEYTRAGGLFLSYRNNTTASACIQNVLYADDLILVAETRRELQHMLDVLDRACARRGMQISVSKTKILTVEEQGKDRQVWTSHPSHCGPSTGGSGVFLLPGQQGGSECQGGERSCNEAREGWQSVPNVEKESLQ